MIITTSRRVSRRTRTFCKDLACCIPLSYYLVRGKKGLREISEQCKYHGMERICVVTTKKGNPASLEFFSENLDYIGRIGIRVSLSREMKISKLKRIEEDLPFLIKTEDRIVATLFNAEVVKEIPRDLYAYGVYKNDKIEFYRLDVSKKPVLKIFVEEVNAQNKDRD